jgi:cell division septation protein DedD
MEQNGAGKISIKLNGKPAEPPGTPPVKAVKAVEPKPNVVEQEESAVERMRKLRGADMKKDQSRVYSHVTAEREILPRMDDVAGEVGGREEKYLYPAIRAGRKQSALLNSPPFKVFVSTIGAIGLGLLFGFLVLAVFTQEQLNQSYRNVLGDTLKTMTATQSTQVENRDQDSPIAQEANSATAEQPGKPVALKLPEQRFSMAQVGAFTDPQAAQVAIDQLTKKGFPHFSYRNGDKEYLFAATASTRDDILGMASLFKNQGMDVYVKDVTLPGLQKEITLAAAQAEGTADPARLQAFFLDGMELARSLTNWSGRYLGASSSGVSAAEEAAIKELHRRFLDGCRVLQASAPATWQPHVTGMQNGLNQAVTALEQAKTVIAEGKAANAESHAWQVQTGALSFLEHYTLLIAEETK